MLAPQEATPFAIKQPNISTAPKGHRPSQRVVFLTQNLESPLTVTHQKDLRSTRDALPAGCLPFQLLQGKLDQVTSQNAETHPCTSSPHPAANHLNLCWTQRNQLCPPQMANRSQHFLKMLVALKSVSQRETRACCLTTPRIKEGCMQALMAAFTQQLWAK